MARFLSVTARPRHNSYRLLGTIRVTHDLTGAGEAQLPAHMLYSDAVNRWVEVHHTGTVPSVIYVQGCEQVLLAGYPSPYQLSSDIFRVITGQTNADVYYTFLLPV